MRIDRACPRASAVSKSCCGGGYWLLVLYSPYVSTVMVHPFSRSMVHMLLLCVQQNKCLYGCTFCVGNILLQKYGSRRIITFLLEVVEVHGWAARQMRHAARGTPRFLLGCYGPDGLMGLSEW